MMNKNNKKAVKDSDSVAVDVDSQAEPMYEQDIEFEPEDSEIESVGKEKKIKKLQGELQEARKQSQEYLTGWQKERASFANHKTDEEKRRKERVEMMKLKLVGDFLPVLDSFEMAFSNREAWEKVDAAWRSGIEYIHAQFMRTLEEYGVSLIDQAGVPFSPMIHEPVEHLSVDSEDQDNTILKIIQKGYRSGDAILRPAKVHVGKYEDK